MDADRLHYLPCPLGCGRREEGSPALRWGEPGLRALEAFLEAAAVLLSLEKEDGRRVQGWATGRTEDLASDIHSDAW